MLHFKKVHITGICGTLTGNVAVFLKHKGFEIRGSDSQFYPPISDMLVRENIFTYDSFSETNLDWKPDLVVIGNAISRGNPEAELVLEKKLNYISVSELIKHEFIGNKKSIVVSGTHGKTTTTSILSYVFLDNGYDPSYIIGGIPSFANNGFRYSDGEMSVIEGDEYDTAFFDKRSKFIHYKPDFLIVNNIEFDHADIFNSIDDILTTFKRVINIVPRNGYIIANSDDSNVMEVCKNNHTQLITYGKNSSADFIISNIKYDDSKTSFDLKYKNKVFNITVPECGMYQIYNMTATFITSYLYGISEDKIIKSLSNFRGVKRRLEMRGEINSCPIIEDFAHHPTAIKGVLSEIKRRYADKKILAVFEPRSNTTRRNIFQNELRDSLSLANEVIIGKINRESQLDDDKLDVGRIISELAEQNIKCQQIADSSDIAKYIKDTVNEDYVCIIMTNGSFDGLFTKLGL